MSIRRLQIAAVLAGAALSALVTPASALTCVDPAEVMRSSAAVFSGELVDVSRREAVVHVDTVWRGSVGRDVTVKLRWFEGFDPLPFVGERYVVALNKGEPVSQCSMWRAGQQHVQTALVETFDGPAQRYGFEGSRASDDRRRIGTVFLGGFATLAFGAAVAWVLVRRRRPRSE